MNLTQHLNDNRLHDSQAVFRNLDSAMVAGLLSPFSITLNGQQFPLVQVAEPIPLRNDIQTLLLGDRQVLKNGFDKLLQALSLVPAGSVQTLNIITHSTSVLRLDFMVGFEYLKDVDRVEHSVDEDPQRPLKNVDFKDLLALPAEFNVDGAPVSLSDVRKAFATDGEVHVFNMGNPLQEEFLQMLANVFQVRTTGFVNKPVRVKATVIAETNEEDIVLSKKIDVGFSGDPVTFQVDFFSHLLLEDRARTGLFTAFPRRA